MNLNVFDVTPDSASVFSAYVLMVYVPWVTFYVWRTNRRVAAQIEIGDKRWRYIRTALTRRPSLEEMALQSVERVVVDVAERVAQARKNSAKEVRKDARAEADKIEAEAVHEQPEESEAEGPSEEDSQEETLDATPKH